jgi:hypothetical protein
METMCSSCGDFGAIGDVDGQGKPTRRRDRRGEV